MLRFRRPLLLLLLAAPALAACGSQSESALTPAHAQPPIPVAAGALPVPLTDADVMQYLQVMREAAQRVQHPTTDERKMLAHADAITAAANGGSVRTSANDGDVLARALAFRMQMDLEVAKARHLDPARYQALSERIEDEAGELHCNGNSPVPDVVVKAHVAEVERLVAIVRNPGPVGSRPVPPACTRE